MHEKKINESFYPRVCKRKIISYEKYIICSRIQVINLPCCAEVAAGSAGKLVAEKIRNIEGYSPDRESERKKKKKKDDWGSRKQD